MTIQDIGFFSAFYGVGILGAAALLPFVPRSEAKTPLKAAGFTLLLGVLWPYLLVLAVFTVFIPWYRVQWLNYLQFLAEYRAEMLKRSGASQDAVEAAERKAGEHWAKAAYIASRQRYR